MLCFALFQLQYVMGFIYMNVGLLNILFAQSARGVEYTECPGYDTKQSDGEVPAVLELWGIWSTPSLSSLPGPLWPAVVASDRALSMG